MSTNRPSNPPSKSGAGGANRPAGTPGPRPANAQGQRPAGAPAPRPSGASGQRAGGSPARPGPPAPGAARRPTPAQATSRVQVRPTRPQARAAQPASAQRYLPFIIGGVLILVALILAGTLFLNNNGGAAGGAGCTGPTDPNGSTACVETSKGVFKIHLLTTDPSVAGTVKNFRDKVNSGYFDGKTFHRVEDWVIQGGDPKGDGTGGGSMTAEYNQVPFKRGAVGMASTAGGGPQVNDSQWFVVKSDADYLDGQYTNFGQVTEGLDVVDKIAIGDKMTKLVMQP